MYHFSNIIYLINNFKQTCFFYIILFVLNLYVGCTSNSNIQWVDAKYVHKDVNNVTLLVMPLSSSSLKHRGDEISQFAQMQLIYAYFNSYMLQALSEKTHSWIYAVDQCFKCNNLEFAIMHLQWKDNKFFEMLVPMSGELMYENVSPKYVLIFEDLTVERGFLPGAVQSYGSRDSYKFKVGVEYLLWDNQNQKLAAYGKLSEERSLQNDSISNTTYKEIFEYFAELIIQKSPIKKATSS